MTSNIKGDQEEQAEKTSTISELDQLRQIVFGDAQQHLITQLETLRSDMEKVISMQEQSFSTRLTKMQVSIEQQLASLDQRIQLFDKTHDDNEASLQKELSRLASEHETFASATQEDFKNLEQSLDSESISLTSTFNEQLEQLKTHLEDVSKELSSSKTDRKTLAKLLATMATNLEDDQL